MEKIILEAFELAMLDMLEEGLIADEELVTLPPELFNDILNTELS